MIRCSRCREEKPESEFHRNRTHANGRANYCKPCTAVIAKPSRRKNYLAHLDEHRARNRARGRRYYRTGRTQDWYLRRTYGISLEERQRMFASQEGTCAICRAPLLDPRTTHVDHDHRSRSVRGILCHKCNLLLGYANDDVGVLMSAIAYLNANKMRSGAVA